MMISITENHVENAALEWLFELSYAVAHGPDISPDGTSPEDTSHDR